MAAFKSLLAIALSTILAINNSNVASAASIRDIVGGSEITENLDLSWFAAFRILTEQMAETEERETISIVSAGQCGGTFINNQTVLTAAHCLPSEVNLKANGIYYTAKNGCKVPYVTVQVGEHMDRLNDLVEYAAKPEAKCTPENADRVALATKENNGVATFSAVKEVICHPQYNTNGDAINDICILKLETPLPIVTPAALNLVKKGVRTPEEVAENARVGAMTTAVGFGQTTYKGESSPEILRSPQQLIDIDVCRTLWTDFGKLLNSTIGSDIDERLICADGRRGETCQGDSGGPLFNEIANVLVGVVSNGGACPSTGIPSRYTRVSAYQKWIEQHAGEITYA